MTTRPLQHIISRLNQQVQASADQAGGSASAQSYLFSHLSPQSLDYLLAHARTQHFNAQQQIIGHGDKVDFLYLVLTGSVRTTRINTNGQEAVVRLLQPGETFMDAIIFMPGPSPVTAIALEDVSLLSIPADIVRQHALKDAQFASNLLRIVTSHYKTAMQQIEMISTKSPVERLGYYLLRLHLEQNPDSLEFTLPFQKAMIASHLGMTPETFSRALAHIRKMGIDIDQKHISLRDAFTLCHFCDSDQSSLCPRAGTTECPHHEGDCPSSCKH